jgi:hypothetical protein
LSDPNQDAQTPDPTQGFDLAHALANPDYVAKYDLFALLGEERPAGLGPLPFSNALNKKLSKPIDTANGESIFDPQVMSRYFDDPSVPESDKQAIAFAYKPSLMMLAFDDAIHQSVGEPLRSPGLLGRAISAVTDIAGNMIGKTFDGLQWPSDKTEQLFGTVLSYGYDSDLSLSERWQMGKLTYEAYGQTGWWKFHGDDQLNAWSQEVASGQKTIDEVIAEHEHGVPDVVGKMILDPLWLLGGLPGVPGKLYKAGEKGAEAYKTGLAASWFKGLAEGIRLENFGSGGLKVAEALHDIPVVGKPAYKGLELLFGGLVPTDRKIAANAISQWRSAIPDSDVAGAIKSWRDAKGLFRLTPEAKADHIYNYLSSTMAAANPTPDDILQLARAVESQDIKQLPQAVRNAFRTKDGQILLLALKEQGIEVSRFPSMLKRIAPDASAWDGAIREGGDVAKEMARTTHRNAGAFTAALQRDLHQIGYPALQRWHGVEGVIKKVAINGEEVERFIPSHSLMQKFTNGMKFWMSTTMLNRPGFAALNYLNNGMTLAFDYGVGRGIKYWLDPFGRRGVFERELADILKADGLDVETIKFIVGDRSVAREMLGTVQDTTFGISNNWIAPMIALTSKFDMGARLHAFYEMYGRSRNAVWRFEGGPRGLTRGILDSVESMDPDLAARLGPEITKRVESAILAAGPDAAKIRAIADDILAHGRPPLTAEHFLEKMADSMNLDGDNRQAFMDMFEPAFRERVTAILADAGSSTERLTSRFDRLRGALRQQEHQAREMDNLMPRPRDYANLPVAAADHEALMAERDKTQLIQLRRYLVATGSTQVDEALKGLAEVQNSSRQRRYVLQYVSQLLDITPQNLTSDVMFQLVPEEMRPAVQAAHRELVLGLDELTPDRGGFYEVLGDLGTRWQKHAEQTMTDLVDFIGTLDSPSQPLMDFFNSIGDVEGRVDHSRASLFADLINNHPGADIPADAAEWVGSRWSQHYGELDNLYNDALDREAGIFGFEHRMSPHARAGENPTVGEMLGVRNSTLEQFLDFTAKGHVLEKDTQPFAGDLKGLTEYLDHIAKIAPDAKRVQTMIARGAADFTMLNYDNRYGIDHWMALVYPYQFWPTRSMWHWAQRGISRPGAVAATAKLYNLIQDVNTDAGIPQRFRNAIRLPIPFLDDSLQGGPMYFDPIKVLFPTADWSADNNFGDSSGTKGSFFGVPRNAFAAVNQWAAKVGPGVNPFIDTALQYAGGDSRALYLKYRFSALPFMIPGPRQLQAMYSFVQSGEDPDGLIDPQTEEDLSLGKHLPEDKLRQALGMNDDEFDIYRTQRVLANQVGEYMKQGHSIEERQAFSTAALNAMFTQKGKLWTNARKVSKQEAGLSVVTGWLFGMPVRQYPNGEATQIGIQALYRQVQDDSRAAGGGDMTSAFTKMFPEIEVRNAAVSIFDGTDKQDSEIAGSLFAQNLDKVHSRYDDRIDNLNGIIDGLTKQGVLKTQEGRRQVDVLQAERDAITQQRSLEIDNLDKTYTDRNQDPSLSRTPRTRALQTLEKQYYAIETPENATSADITKQRTQQQAFIEKLPTEQTYVPFAAAINNYAVTHGFDRQITAAYDAGDREAAQKLIEQRQQFVIDSTTQIQGQITQKEFRQYLDRNKRTPTSDELEYDQAKDQIAEYSAIKDRAGELGYTSKETAALAGAYWDAHPLLAKYYGNGPGVTAHTYEDITRFDRMQSIWDQFYSLDGGSQARIDYLAMTLTELNGLRRHFGLPPININDPYWNTEAPPPRYEGSLPQGY